VTQKTRTILGAWSLAAAGALLLAAAGTAHGQVRVGSTIVAIPGDGITKRFPDVAFDDANDAYLVVTGLATVEARYVAPNGAPLGATVKVSTTTAGAARVACAPAINRCLIVWLQEPRSVVGRLVRYNAGAVQALTMPFVINGALAPLLTNSAPGVVYSSVSNEFLIAWTDYSPGPNIRARRVDGNGAPVGVVVPIAVTTLWEGFPTLAYNSAQNEYNVGYYFETSSGASSVGTQRVRPGTGVLIGGRSTLYSGGFNQYPELAYNPATNQYLAITWGFSGSSWMLRGRLADGNSQPLGASTLALAAKGGGDGVGLGYNPMSNTYLADYQSQTNPETWGVEISPAGAPGTQRQLSVSGTTQSVQPRTEANTGANQWLMVTSNAFKNIMVQVVGHAFTLSGGCTTPSPGTGYTCVNGKWVAPTSSGTATCTTIKPASNWVCVNGNWLPPWMVPSTSSCTTPSPGTGYTCVNGTWVAPTKTSDGTCTTIKPAADWYCKNGNWLPPWY
jgi:hypothetical protein